MCKRTHRDWALCDRGRGGARTCRVIRSLSRFGFKSPVLKYGQRYTPLFNFNMDKIQSQFKPSQNLIQK